ncbi:carboxylesterase family protein, partial [Caulobacter sp. HMWF025]
FGSDPARARRWIAAQDAPVAQVLGKVYATSPADPDPVRGDLAMQVATDRMFRCPGEHVAAVRSRGGDKVWRYELEVPPPGGAAVTHGSELGFVFDAPEGPPLQAYWLNFAHGGDPNGPGLKAWPTYGSQADYLAFTATGPVERRGLGRAACLSLQRP